MSKQRSSSASSTTSDTSGGTGTELTGPAGGPAPLVSNEDRLDAVQPEGVAPGYLDGLEGPGEGVVEAPRQVLPDASGAELGDPVSPIRPDFGSILNAGDKAWERWGPGAGDVAEEVGGRLPVPERLTTDLQSVTVGFADDKQFTVGGSYSDRYREVRDESGALGGSYLNTERGLNGEVVTGPASAHVTIGGGVESSTQVLASLQADGTALDQDALQARADRFNDTDAAHEEGEDEVRAAITDLRSWGEGDRIETARQTNLNLGLARPGLVGAGVSYESEGVETRTVERLDGDRVRLTLSEADSSGVDIAGTAGFGIAEVGYGRDGERSNAQAFDFDLATEDGQRDYALAQYTGAFPGAAEALGITSLDDAIAFIEAGGFDSLGEDDAFPSAAALNASLMERATDPESTFGADNGWVSTEEREATGQDLGVGIAGIDLASARWEQENGTAVAFENGAPVTTFEGRSGYSQQGLILEDGQEGSSVRAFDDGRFSAAFYTSFGEDTRDASGPLVEAYNDSEEVREAVSDPTYVRTINGDLGAFGEAYLALDRDPDRPTLGAANDVAMRYWPALDEGSMEIANEAMLASGQTPGEYIVELGETLTALERGEIEVSELRLDQALIYADEALELPGDARFEGIAMLASHDDPRVAAEAMARLVGSGDEDVIDEFATWVRENGLEDTISIDSAVFAGNTDLNTAVAALDENNGRRAASHASQALEDLVSADMSPEALQETLLGFDATAAGEDGGGLDRFYRALPTNDRAAFIELAGQTDAGQAFLADLAATRPDMLIDPSVAPEDRAQWVRDNLGGVFDDIEPDTFLAAAETSRDAALAEGDATSFGPEVASVYSRFATGNDGDNINRLRAVAEARGEDIAAFAQTLIGMDDALASHILLMMHEGNPPEYVGVFSERVDRYIAEARSMGLDEHVIGGYALNRADANVGEDWNWQQFYATGDGRLDGAP